jgi:protein-L-isoaspartate(D-aspartate) O-methyltransferase
LNLQKTERVLEIGAGSGYMAALLAQHADQVVSLEIDPVLAAVARGNLERAGIRNASVRVGDGARSNIPDGPFDAILLSGSVAEVPSRLLDLLRDGGRLIAIAGQEPVMRVTTVRKQGNRFDVSYPWDTNTARLLNFAEPSAFRF